MIFTHYKVWNLIISKLIVIAALHFAFLSRVNKLEDNEIRAADDQNTAIYITQVSSFGQAVFASSREIWDEITRSIKNNNAPIISKQFPSRHISEKLLLESVPTWPVVFSRNGCLIAKERFVAYKYTLRQIHHITAIRSNTPIRHCSKFFPLNNPSVTSDLQSFHSLIIPPSEMASPADVTDQLGPFSL